MSHKYKVNTPEKGYTGSIAGVSFVNGEGNTNDEWAVNWFRENGYSITEINKDKLEESVENDKDKKDDTETEKISKKTKK